MRPDRDGFPLLEVEDIGRLTRAELGHYLAAYNERERRRGRRKLFTFYPDTGPLRRELYPRHLEFFRKGAQDRERLALCANRVGKTEGMGGYETAVHLTGRYPKWWEGARFYRPIRAWAAGKNNETTRDIVQAKLLGETISLGTGRKIVDGSGLVPAEDIGAASWKRGSDLIDRVAVKHHDARGQFDGWSRLGFKSYEQGRGSFEGTEQDVIWFDEEPPLAVYTEALTRTMTTRGLVMLTFTPLEGMSEVVLAFLPNGELPGGGRNAIMDEPDEKPDEEEPNDASERYEVVAAA